MLFYLDVIYILDASYKGHVIVRSKNAFINMQMSGNVMQLIVIIAFVFAPIIWIFTHHAKVTQNDMGVRRNVVRLCKEFLFWYHCNFVA